MKELGMSQNNDHIQATLQRIIDAISDVRNKQDQQTETLIRNTVSLEEHMRRTELLEEANNKTNERLEPVIKHVDAVNLILKIGAAALTLVGIVAAMKQGGLI